MFRLRIRLMLVMFALGLGALALLSACGGGTAAVPATKAAASSPATQALSTTQASPTSVSTATSELSRTVNPTTTANTPTTAPSPAAAATSAQPTSQPTTAPTSQPQVSTAAPSWQQVGPGTGVQLQSVSCQSAKFCLAAGAQTTLIKSTDGGATWSPKQINAPDSVISQVYCQSESKCLALVADPLSGTGGIFGSGDGGETWTETETWDEAGGVIDIVSCVGAGACYGIGEGGVLQRGAADPHWQMVNGSVFPAPPPARYLVNIACPLDQLCLALGRPRVNEEGIILRITNGGADASRVSNLSQDLRGINFDAITCQNDATCLAAGSNGVIIKSEDGGATWSRSSWTPPPSQGPLELRSINCPSASVCFLVGGNPVTGECCGVIIRTVDGGKTWTNEKLDLPYFLKNVRID